MTIDSVTIKLLSEFENMKGCAGEANSCDDLEASLGTLAEGTTISFSDCELYSL